jgi:hypothetical protein
MLRYFLAAGAIALSLTMPVFAQTSTPMQSTTPAGAMSPQTAAMTCDQMMAKAGTMSTSASGGRMAMEQKEMSLARQARAQKDEAGCKMHMEKAMRLMR